jgi:hypothetical protein
MSLNEDEPIGGGDYEDFLSRAYSSGIPQIEFDFLDEGILSPIEKFKRYLNSPNSCRR